jgi:hypothetical protein
MALIAWRVTGLAPRRPCRTDGSPRVFREMSSQASKDVSEEPAFLDLYRVDDDRFEAENSLEKLAGLAEVERREADGKILCAS